MIWTICEYEPPHKDVVWIADGNGQSIAEEVPRELAPLIAAAPKTHKAAIQKIQQEDQKHEH